MLLDGIEERAETKVVSGSGDESHLRRRVTVNSWASCAQDPRSARGAVMSVLALVDVGFGMHRRGRKDEDLMGRRLSRSLAGDEPSLRENG